MERQPARQAGKPLFEKPLEGHYPGATAMGAEEAAALSAVAMARSPFRYYGLDLQHQTRSFEDHFARYLNVRYTLGVTSCTAALFVALKALQLGYGDKVAVPAFTFLATAGAVVSAGAVPVFIDIDDSMGIDPLDLDRKLAADNEIRAVIIVPLLGYPCDMAALLAVAAKHGVRVIEDVAQSCGASYAGRKLGTFGDIGVFSFQMNKLITAGDGGAVVTSDPALFIRAVRYHDQGIFREQERYGLQSPDEADAFAGLNFRMSEFTGAAMGAQLVKLPDILRRMRIVHDLVRGELQARAPQLRLRKLYDEEGCAGCYVALVLPTPDIAQEFIRALAADNITSYLLYGGMPLFRRDIFRLRRTAEKDDFPYNYPFRNPIEDPEQSCPCAIDLCPRTVFIPISPDFTREDGELLVTGILSFF
ncbi:DegT/DnrJ/EryC1/StrS family aminotransferase [Paenibacillus eucommiae]|uniref:8-amino-3,8-dideoxy-alpha-D-manno-octulosonate transaminase n=1 Tax=Paenibacillus eucommiae TaxID=1355755 RepID=A0ABS4J531_9BACL|nr:DegT/DnrJ/EryC1/StrS family aminotransferase [Paenibacillus eucommiae]MBP1994939.1 8-amino-3,8-dideoxy-alpha-D-manno-octulosonate transaminase [Paenibacillus eucommiae]